MDLNLNIVLPPPIERILKKMPFESVSGYPSQTSRGMREVLAKRYSVTPEQIVVGSGSSELIDWAVKAFVEPGDRINTVEPGFSIYDFFAKVNMIEVWHLRLNEGTFDIDWQALARAKGACIIASPNNPTGNAFDEDRILEHVAKCERDGYVFMLDEAYGEYARLNVAKHVDEFSNLVVFKTFSKAYGIAGARVGYAVASKEAAVHLAKVRQPFALNAMSEFLALGVLGLKGYMEKVVSTTERGIRFVTKELADLGFKVYPSKANFVLARAPKGTSSTVLTRQLAERGIMIKDFSSTPMLENCMRITVGSRGINEQLLETVREITIK
jgi:histidinol-phosphate aminotransferase